MQEFSLVVYAVVHKELVKCCVLHYPRNVGVAAVGEVVARLQFVTMADALASFLRVEITDGKRARAVERVDGVRRLVNGIHCVGCVPVIYQLLEAEFSEQRLIKRPVARRRIVIACLLDGAAFRPVLEQYVGDGEQVAQFGVLQFLAEICGAPVAAVGHLAGHTVVDV